MSLKLLKNKSFALLILGQFVSNVGTIMQDVALSLYILKITGSGKMFASVMAISVIPNIILGPVCGVFADWFDRKKIIVYMNMLCGILTGILYILSITTGLGIAHIYITVILLSIISCLFNPAISTAIPSIMKKEELLEANSFSSVVMTLSSVLGPTLAGTMYGIFGLPLILIINSLSFIFASISELFINIPSVKKSGRTFSFKRFKSDFIEGIKLIRTKTLIAAMLITGCILNFAYNPMMSTGLTYISKIVLKISDAQYGLLQTILVGGAIIGPLLARPLSKKLELYKIYYLGIVGIGILIAVMSLVCFNIINNSIIAFSILAACGLLIVCIISFTGVSISTIKQHEIPIEYLGRVNSVWTAVSMSAIPLGQMCFGPMFDKFPGYIPVIIAAIILIITAIVFALVIKGGKKKVSTAGIIMDKTSEM